MLIMVLMISNIDYLIDLLNRRIVNDMNENEMQKNGMMFFVFENIPLDIPCISYKKKIE